MREYAPVVGYLIELIAPFLSLLALLYAAHFSARGVTIIERAMTLRAFFAP